MATKPAKKASQEDWHPAKVKMELHVRGITLSALAEQHGLTSSSTLSAALTRSYPANEKRIADAIGVHPMEIWPSRYNADGSRKPQGFRALQFNAATLARNGNLRAVA
ncbi:helix-turn-helix domain-containing protein [Rhodocyclus tenuis]|uniref:Lambda repressor-like predicted transcriptional regulator n=1 Tax=Rhodocyclus tenuis TaxID=1066 RepID=A0A840G8Q1_RHOTE|nr:helix-turn-helix transcriptional regulator [Rhodocyclus tenuis]MBB4247290.1 lambda repressor-like predicted transcriptional regulator [Rhodocyclus tenuis]